MRLYRFLLVVNFVFLLLFFWRDHVDTLVVVAMVQNYEKKNGSVSSCGFSQKTFFSSSSRPRSREQVSLMERVKKGIERGGTEAVDTSSSYFFSLLPFSVGSHKRNDVVHQYPHPHVPPTTYDTNEVSLDCEMEEDKGRRYWNSSENASPILFFQENNSDINDTSSSSSSPPPTTGNPNGSRPPRPPPVRNDGHFWIWGIGFGIAVFVLSVALLGFFLIRRYRRVTLSVQSVDASNEMKQEEGEEEMVEEALELKLYGNIEEEEREGKEEEPCMVVPHDRLPSSLLRSSVFSSPGSEDERG